MGICAKNTLVGECRVCFLLRHFSDSLGINPMVSVHQNIYQMLMGHNELDLSQFKRTLPDSFYTCSSRKLIVKTGINAKIVLGKSMWNLHWHQRDGPCASRGQDGDSSSYSLIWSHVAEGTGCKGGIYWLANTNECTKPLRWKCPLMICVYWAYIMKEHSGVKDVSNISLTHFSSEL